MRKEEKLDIINAIAAQLEETPNFYIADIAGLNAGKTHQLRKACFEAGVKLVVVKNTLLTKVLEQGENEEAKNLIPVLAGPTAILFTEAPNAPAKVIKSFKEKGNEKPVLKGAFIQEWPAFIGEDKLDALYGIKSREELIGDIIGLLQSPIRNVLSALEHKDDEKNEEAAAE
ncbi:MAG: 50S ribosomal protein L10 [Bacteroidales bacterium]|nr:50S ribosomal protein L10 [Bacteroidales bacterium]